MKDQSASFVQNPHKTLIYLAVPALLSLIVEPLTGLVDTGFVSRLGSVPLAALGVGTTALSSTFWVFNFLGIGTQTGVAQALGRHDQQTVRRLNGLALVMAGVIGFLLIGVGYFLLDTYAKALGASGEVLTEAVSYMRIRLFGAPAVLLMLTAMGTMRGLQDMKTPFYISFLVNGLNIVLDGPFIFGVGGWSGMEVAGAALASTISQWIGALWAIIHVVRRLGWPRDLAWGLAWELLQVGRDLFMRTGTLMLYFIFTTRIATQIGADSGAAHQAVRQVWILMALVLEAFAMTGQSLVGYFMGAFDVRQARRVAAVSLKWSLGTGVVLTAVMWLVTDWIVTLFVPETAVSVFRPAWWVAAAFQPINAVAFITDGLHWGTADYRYLRNGMFLATLIAAPMLFLIDQSNAQALTLIWGVTAVWILIRAVWGFVRIWPGTGSTPFLVAKEGVTS